MQALQNLADKERQAMQFTEVHHSDELHGHAYDVVLQVVLIRFHVEQV